MHLQPRLLCHRGWLFAEHGFGGHGAGSAVLSFGRSRPQPSPGSASCPVSFSCNRVTCEGKRRASASATSVRFCLRPDPRRTRHLLTPARVVVFLNVVGCNTSDVHFHLFCFWSPSHSASTSHPVHFNLLRQSWRRSSTRRTSSSKTPRCPSQGRGLRKLNAAEAARTPHGCGAGSSGGMGAHPTHLRHRRALAPIVAIAFFLFAVMRAARCVAHGARTPACAQSQTAEVDGGGNVVRVRHTRLRATAGDQHV